MGEGNYTRQEDNICNILRSDILALKLKPGLIFSIKDLSEAYQAGRSPMRDALISLQKEGLITSLPQRGTPGLIRLAYILPNNSGHATK